MKLLLPCFLLGACCCLPAQDAAHPNFTGTWHLDPAKSQIHTKVDVTEWAIRQDDNSIAIDEQMPGHTESLKCGTDGSNCKAKPEGEAGEVMFYYNGGMLVETDLLGHSKDHVVKKRMKMGDGGKTMEIEILHVSPAGPTEKWVFAKLAEAK
jgi:hypothetical protein